MAEHRVCNAGVRGSSPLTSTSHSDLRFEISDLKLEASLALRIWKVFVELAAVS